MIKEKLSDFSTLITVKTDKFKSNYLSVAFLVPLDCRTAAMNTLMLKILKRGTASYPNMIELSKKLELAYSADVYARSVIMGEAQLLSFAVDVLDNSYALDGTDILRESVEVLTEMIFSPVIENGMFKNSYFESEKKNLIEEINAEINNKGRYAFSQMKKNMFCGERFAASPLGDKETVVSITNEELYRHYTETLKSSEMIITFVGNADETDIASAVSKITEKYSPKVIKSVETDIIRKADTPKYITEHCNAKQGNLVLGFRTASVLGDGDYTKMALFSELYGGCATSKLFMNVREKMSLCYFCTSIPEAFKGAMFVRAGIENKNYEKAKNEILHQLDLIAHENFTDEEFFSAKLSLINAYREISDNPQYLQNWYAGRQISNIDQSPEEAISAVQAITRRDIAETASRITLDTVYFLSGNDNECEEE